MIKADELIVEFEHLSIDEQIKMLNILKRREEISQKAEALEIAIKNGKAKRGSVTDLLEDLES
ncbi:MAG: hypothetical protein OEV44_06270 [Spirochaetota bacterium]|nr:hypothetical protein [Spirochaetota bacterium]